MGGRLVIGGMGIPCRSFARSQVALGNALGSEVPLRTAGGCRRPHAKPSFARGHVPKCNLATSGNRKGRNAGKDGAAGSQDGDSRSRKTRRPWLHLWPSPFCFLFFLVSCFLPTFSPISLCIPKAKLISTSFHIDFPISGNPPGTFRHPFPVSGNAPASAGIHFPIPEITRRSIRHPFPMWEIAPRPAAPAFSISGIAAGSARQPFPI